MYCRGLQHRLKWVVLHSEGNKNGKIDHMEHRTHLQDTNNGTAVPLKAEYERLLTFRGTLLVGTAK